MTARMLDLALCPFERNKYLQQLNLAGLICFTRTLPASDKDTCPRMLTLMTCPNDRMELEAENLKIMKRVSSRNQDIRGPRTEFFCATEEEPYPYTPYFEEPNMGTGTADCIFTCVHLKILLCECKQGLNSISATVYVLTADVGQYV